MNRTQKLFLLFIGLAVAIVGIAAVWRASFRSTASTALSADAVVTVVPATRPTPLPTVILKPTPIASISVALPKPTLAPTPAVTASPISTEVATQTLQYQIIRGPNYQPNDGLPTFLCITYSNGSYFTPQLIQMAGLDIQNGFHLGLVPLDLNIEVPEETAAKMVRDGVVDCTMTTLDSVAIHNPGVVTAIIDESAGTDQIWARNVQTVNGLKGKKIAVGEADSTEFLALYALNTVGLDPNKDVELVRFDGLESSLKAFADGSVDAVSGWEPAILDMEKFGGKRLLTTRDFRAVIDVIATSRKSITDRPEVVNGFHKAWFAALNLLSTDFDKSARLLADWGNNDYTGISKDNAADDFRGQLATIAQADLAQNVRLMRQPNLIYDRITDMRQLWQKSGVQTPRTPVQVDPSFVLSASDDSEKRGEATSYKLVNRTFLWGQQDAIAIASQATPQATQVASATVPTATPLTTTDRTPIAVLPCSRFDFAPNSTQLLAQSQKLLDDCVIRTMQQTVGLVLRLRGSSAWPGPKGKYSQQQVEQMALSRAQSIANYLASKGIDAKRLLVEKTLPPPEHRETDDLLKQAEDRFVEMTLLASGL